MSKDAHFFIIAPRCQVTAFTICNWICATMQPGLQSERKFFFYFFVGSFWGTHINSNVARQDANCNLLSNQSVFNQFQVCIGEYTTHAILHDEMQLRNYATRPRYNHATMPLAHPALQSKCKLKDHNRRLHLRQGLATETIVANHSESCETGFGVETVYMEKCWREVMTAQVYCLPLAKILPTVVFPQAFLLFFCPKTWFCNFQGVLLAQNLVSRREYLS